VSNPSKTAKPTQRPQFDLDKFLRRIANIAKTIASVVWAIHKIMRELR
jgi:hypothetical protein